MKKIKRIKLSGVYQIINLINDKRYIGSSKNIYKRWNVHKDILNKNNHINIHLQNAWNKYGEENFKFEIIEEISEDFLKFREQFYLDCYNYENTFNKLLYNIARDVNCPMKGLNKNNCFSIRKISKSKTVRLINIDYSIEQKICFDYINNKLSPNNLYKKYNISLHLIRRILKDYNIKTRTLKESQNGNSNGMKIKANNKLNNDIIKKIILLFEKNKYRIGRISDELNLNWRLISRVLKENNINTKNNDKLKRYEIYKNNIIKFVIEEELQEYLISGWISGKSDLTKNKIRKSVNNYIS